MADAVADDALFGPDGTQDPPPPPVLPDPLAGLVTGAATVREGTGGQRPLVRPPTPPAVDSSMREAIDAALAEPRGRRRPLTGQPRPGQTPATSPAAAPARGAGVRPANAAGCLVTGLIMLAILLATLGRAIIDVVSHVFH